MAVRLFQTDIFDELDAPFYQRRHQTDSHIPYSFDKSPYYAVTRWALCSSDNHEVIASIS